MKWLFSIVIFLIGFSLSFNPANGQIPDFLWAQRAGGSGDDFGIGVATDNFGNIVVTGAFEGTASFATVTLTSEGLQDIFIAKYDAQGNLLWAKRAGGTGDDLGWGVAIDGSDNIVVCGSFSGTAGFGDTTLTSMGGDDVFIAKYDGDGGLLWLQQAGGPASDGGTALAFDSFGNIVVTGAFESTASFDDTTLTSVDAGDIFIAQYDREGRLLWARSAGGDDYDAALDIATDHTDTIVITGVFWETVTFGDTTLINVEIGVSDAEADIFIAKYDGNGSFLWARHAGGRGRDEGDAIATDASGDIIVTGAVESTATFGDTTLPSFFSFEDIFVAKYDENGDFLWARRAGGMNADAGGNDLAVDGSGNIVVTGNFEIAAISFGDTSLTSLGGSEDIFVVKYDESGNVLWAQRAGGSGEDFGVGVATDNFGNIVVTGAFEGTANFGQTTLTSEGGQDILIAKFETEAVTGIEQQLTFPRSFHLMQNYPNPFNPTTVISYKIAEVSDVELTIYNPLGQKVRTLINKRQPAGHYQLEWDGRNNAGKPVVSGVYMYRLEAGSFVKTRQMVLLK